MVWIQAGVGRRLFQNTSRCPPRADIKQWEQTRYHGGVCLPSPALQAVPKQWQEGLEHPAASGHEEMEMMKVNSLGR